MEKILSQNLKFLRKNFGYNLNQLADKLGISKSSISDYENGKFIPTFNVIDKYCKHFDIEISALNSVAFEEANFENYTVKNSNKQSEEFKTLQIRNELLTQRVEGIQIQNKLLQQLLDSKESELKTLKIQVELLFAR